MRVAVPLTRSSKCFFKSRLAELAGQSSEEITGTCRPPHFGGGLSGTLQAADCSIAVIAVKRRQNGARTSIPMPWAWAAFCSMCRDRKRQAEVDVCQRDTISGAGRGQDRAVAMSAEAVEGEARLHAQSACRL